MRAHVDYTGIADLRERDEKACKDIKSYLGAKVWKVLLEEARKVKTGLDFQQLNIAMSFAGVEGFPVHAFGRLYCLVGYRDWMMSDAIAGNPVPVDEHGYRIEEEV